MSLSNVVTISKNNQVHELAQQLAQSVFSADNLDDARELSARINPELVIFDQWFESQQVQNFTENAKLGKDVPVILLVDEQADLDVTDSLEFKTFKYIKSPNNLESLKNIIKNAKKQTTPDHQPNDRFFINHLAENVGLVGKSDAAKSLINNIKIVANSNCNPVLITGETGTGKEVAAKALHLLKHPDKPFVAINCAALTTTLLESELFGHERGSFTGAEKEKPGLLELANDGTVFLDEISEMPLELQAKLLRVLQEKEFRRVGGTKTIKCNATIIAASNLNLKNEAKEKRFRLDLYFRLNIFPIKIQPLKAQNRCEDIKILAEYFLNNSNICPDKTGKIKGLTKLAIDALTKHHWPGNIRELKNTIERAIMLETTNKIGLNSIILETDGTDCLENAKSHQTIKNFSIEFAEKQLIARALQESKGKKTKAASMLGISRATLYAKVKQYNIENQNQNVTSNQPEPYLV